MPHSPLTAPLVEAVATQQQGAGDFLRIVLVVMVLGCALTGWFLLRGYKREDD